MIRIGTRHNLLYPLTFSIFNGMREIFLIIMKKKYDYSGSTFLTFIMLFSDFISGLIIYLRHKKHSKEKLSKKFMGIELIQAPTEIKPADSKIQMIFLIIFLAYIDFVESIFSSYYIPDRFSVSKSLEMRLKSIIICVSGAFSFFVLKIPIFKHQIFSIIIILICLLVTISTEMVEYYREHNKVHGLRYIIFIIFLFIINQTFTSGCDIIEKYLLEYDFINPFKLLMLEGAIGMFFCLLFTIHQDPFEQLKIIKKDHPEYLKYLIICIFIFFLFSCGRNIYRIISNKLYSPTSKALFDYIFVPFFIIYYFTSFDDFTVHKKKKYYYFAINLILSFIIVICCLIYNDLIVLFFCNLEHDTYYEVSKRAKKIQSEVFELTINDSCDSNLSDID